MGPWSPSTIPFFFERWPFRSDDRWEELRALSLPVLVVRADQTWVRAEIAERMAAEAPDGRFVQISDSGHLIAVEQPAELGRALKSFFSEETDPKD
jgi:pimeloyl-ACP methyl ester carboxylesterase